MMSRKIKAAKPFTLEDHIKEIYRVIEAKYDNFPDFKNVEQANKEFIKKQILGDTPKKNEKELFEEAFSELLEREQIVQESRIFKVCLPQDHRFNFGKVISVGEHIWRNNLAWFVSLFVFFVTFGIFLYYIDLSFDIKFLMLISAAYAVGYSVFIYLAITSFYDAVRFIRSLIERIKFKPKHLLPVKLAIFFGFGFVMVIIEPVLSLFFDGSTLAIAKLYLATITAAIYVVLIDSLFHGTVEKIRKFFNGGKSK